MELPELMGASVRVDVDGQPNTKHLLCSDQPRDGGCQAGEGCAAEGLLQDEAEGLPHRLRRLR